jgi:asparagine synthase (glutamine-hydrolysing)
MPGIFGLITKRPCDWAQDQLRLMTQTLLHEPFYVNGVWTESSLGVYVGWTARKGSADATMPLCNERDDITLIFSGEEFPDTDTRRRLKENGHKVGPGSLSHLVHLYEEDPSFFRQLNGRFQGVLTDRTTGTTTLFNDRFGLQRIYYHESKEAFYFAAEAKAILAVRPELREINAKAMGEYIACGCVMENRTLFEGIQVLPPASSWTVRQGVLEKKSSYFEPQEWEGQPPVQQEAYYQRLEDIFSRNLRRYFESDERMGMSLTGGLDTRMIMAWQKAAPGSLPCYSFGGPYRDCQDVVIARKVAQICGQTHQVIPVGREFLSQFPKYAERTVYLTDCCADVNRASDLYANERAREIAPMRMTGNYGSEVLRRTTPRRPNEPTPAFKPVDPMSGLFRPEVLTYIDLAKQTYQSALQTNATSFAVFRQAPWHHYGLLALEQSQLGVRTPFLDNDLVRTVFRAPQSTLLNSDICLRLIAHGNAELGRIRMDRGLGGDQSKAIAAITRAYLEFTFRAEYAYDYGMPQRVARVDHTFSALHLERLFLGRHKFAHYRVWYRDELSGYVREMLLDQKTLSRPYLNKNTVEPMVKGHLKGNRNYTTEIHKLLTLELIHRLFLDVK